MAVLQENQSSLGLTPLVTGIIKDAQDLMRQQLTLFQVELRKDLARAKQIAILYGIAGLVGVIALIILAHMAALGLVEIWPQLPLVAAYGIVGSALLAVAGIVAAAAKIRSDSFPPLAEKSVESLKENIQWTEKT